MGEPSRGARETADRLIEEILVAADKHKAPCFRDDLADNREWVRVLIAAALDRAADGRPLMCDENGPY